MKVVIEYKRGRKDTIDAAKRTTWESRCQKFRVQKYESLFGERDQYYAMRLSVHFGWRMLEHMRTYRTRNAAQKALEKWVRQGSTISLNERKLSSNRGLSGRRSGRLKF